MSQTKMQSGRSPAPVAKSPASKSKDYSSEGVKDNDISKLGSTEWQLLGAMTLVGLFVRLFRISQPTSVVFDEVQYVALQIDGQE